MGPQKETNARKALKEASHGACCDRSGWQGIADLRHVAGWRDPAGRATFHPWFEGMAGQATAVAGRDGELRRGVRNRGGCPRCGARCRRRAGEPRAVLGRGIARRENRRADARNLAEASCRMRKLPAVHVPSETSRQRKSICGVREALVGTRTKLVNCLRGWLRTQGAGPIRSGSVETFTRRFLEHAKVREIPVPMAISRVIETIDGINKQIEAADDELDTIAQEDPVCRRLMTAPGVGPVTAVRFAAAIDDVTRFDRASAVQSYLGLVPGEDSSSDRRKVTGITKAGARHVRWALVQAAWSARRWYKSDPIVQWALQIEARRGRHIAIVALARKLAGVLHAMWRRGVDYDPTHASRVPEGANAA